MNLVKIDRMAWVRVPNIKQALELKSKYTLEAKNLDGAVTVIKTYEESDDPCLIGLPRGLFSNRPVSASWASDKIVFTKKLRSKQDALISAFKAYLKSHPSGGILQAPTGVGKTVMGLYMSALIGGPVLIVVPLTKLLPQWKGEIQTFTNQKDVGLVQGSVCNFKNFTFSVAMMHSLAQKKYPEDFYSYFRLVIFDEVHTLGAKTFSEVGKQFHCECRIGLSATPLRTDGMDKVSNWHIGTVIRDGRFKPDLIPEVYIIQTKYIISHPNGLLKKTRVLALIINQIANNFKRNKLIIKIIKRLYKKGRNILVLSDRIVQLDFFYNNLNKECVSRFYGKHREDVNKINLATYGSAGTGLNIPQLDVLIIATPKNRIEQAVGRVLRKHADKKIPIVIDFQDTTYTRLYSNMFKSRLRFYNKIKSKIKYIKEETVWNLK